MKRTDLAKKVSEDCGLPLKEANELVQVTFNAIAKGLADSPVSAGARFGRFGKFSMRKLTARTGYNAAAGEATENPDNIVIKFRPYFELEDAAVLMRRKLEMLKEWEEEERARINAERENMTAAQLHDEEEKLNKRASSLIAAIKEDSIKEMEEEIKQLREESEADRKQMMTEAQKRRKELMKRKDEESKALLAEHEEYIKQLEMQQEEERKREQEEADRRRNELLEQKIEETQLQLQKKDEEIQKIRQEQEKQIAALKREQEDALAKEREEKEAEAQRLRQEQETEAQRLRQEQEEQIAALKREQEEALAKVEKDAEAQRLQKEQEEILAKERAEKEAEVQRLRREQEAEAERLQKEQEEKLSALKRELGEKERVFKDAQERLLSTENTTADLAFVSFEKIDENKQAEIKDRAKINIAPTTIKWLINNLISDKETVVYTLADITEMELQAAVDIVEGIEKENARKKEIVANLSFAEDEDVKFTIIETQKTQNSLNDEEASLNKKIAAAKDERVLNLKPSKMIWTIDKNPSTKNQVITKLVDVNNLETDDAVNVVEELEVKITSDSAKETIVNFVAESAATPKFVIHNEELATKPGYEIRGIQTSYTSKIERPNLNLNPNVMSNVTWLINGETCSKEDIVYRLADVATISIDKSIELVENLENELYINNGVVFANLTYEDDKIHFFKLKKEIEEKIEIVPEETNQLIVESSVPEEDKLDMRQTTVKWLINDVVATKADVVYRLAEEEQIDPDEAVEMVEMVEDKFNLSTHGDGIVNLILTEDAPAEFKVISNNIDATSVKKIEEINDRIKLNDINAGVNSIPEAFDVGSSKATWMINGLVSTKRNVVSRIVYLTDIDPKESLDIVNRMEEKFVEITAGNGTISLVKGAGGDVKFDIVNLNK